MRYSEGSVSPKPSVCNRCLHMILSIITELQLRHERERSQCICEKWRLTRDFTYVISQESSLFTQATYGHRNLSESQRSVAEEWLRMHIQELKNVILVMSAVLFYHYFF